MSKKKVVDFFKSHEAEMGQLFLNILWNTFGLDDPGKIFWINRGILAFKAENERPFDFGYSANGVPSSYFIISSSASHAEFLKRRKAFVKMSGDFGFTVKVKDPFKSGMCYVDFRVVDVDAEVFGRAPREMIDCGEEESHDRD